MHKAFNRIQFDSQVSKGSGGGFKIWIPKHIVEMLPSDLWIIDAVYLRKEGFKQTLKKHPCSKAGVDKRYIPIYTDDLECDDYLGLGKISVEMVYEE